MKIKSLKLTYYIKMALKSLVRNSVMSLTSILVLLSCLVMVGTFWVVSKNVSLNLEQIRGYNKIVAFLDYSTDDYTIEDLQNTIETFGNVERVLLVTREEALEAQIKQYADSQFLYDLYKDDNPLKDSFEITYKNTDEVDTLIYQLEQLEPIVKINNRLDIAVKIDNLKNAFSLVFSWLLILLFFVSLFVIINTIKLSVFARRDQISIMRYVGATNFFISFPFLIEGVVIGLIASIGSYGLQFLIYKYLVLEMIGDYDIFTIIPFEELRLPLLGAFALLGVLIGMFGSLISLHKYNKEKKSI